ITVCAIRLACLALSFILAQGLNFREVTSLRHVQFLGATVVVPRGVFNPWTHVAEIASVLILVFVIDASIGLWRRVGSDGRRRAVIVGGSIIFFVLLANVSSALVHRELINAPYLVSFPFAAIVLAMAFELGSDLFRAQQVAQKLQLSEA